MPAFQFNTCVTEQPTVPTGKRFCYKNFIEWKSLNVYFLLKSVLAGDIYEMAMGPDCAEIDVLDMTRICVSALQVKNHFIFSFSNSVSVLLNKASYVKSRDEHYYINVRI